MIYHCRSHHCGQLSATDVGNRVVLSGWINIKRDHGKLLFIDLRDHFGITQCVVDQSHTILYDKLKRLPCESVITVEGKVVKRALENVNDNITTGKVEVKIDVCNIDNTCHNIPFAVNSDADKVAEELSIKYRFLYLRKHSVRKNILFRNNFIKAAREFFYTKEFQEFNTPILTAASPEGARDFIVPSRLHPNKYYALPQAPQQFKQLLMISGFDKYFQIAPCFRDEDARADRSPGEFYQIDVEMSFVDQEKILALSEELISHLFKDFASKDISPTPFVRIKYKDAMLKYGSDKPDLRNPLIIQDVTDIFYNSGFSMFAEQVKSGSVVRCIKVARSDKLTRAFIDKITQICLEHQAKGLAYLKWDVDMQVKGPIAKFLTTDDILKLSKRINPTSGDTVFFICDEIALSEKILYNLRNILGQELGLINNEKFCFCWIVDFPLYELDKESGKLKFSHNPFSLPKKHMQDKLHSQDVQDHLHIEAYQYDLVCNGVEIASGAVRNHKLDVLYKTFDLVGYTKQMVDEKFPGLTRALVFGCPVHAGIAFGLERLIMILLNIKSIKDVIPFPMDSSGKDTLVNAPSHLSDDEIRYLNIKNIPK